MGRAKKLLGLLIGVVVIYVTWTLVPIYLAKFQFEDELANIAKFSADHSEEQIHDEVMKKAQEIGVPVPSESVHVMKDQGKVTITTNYVVVIKLPTGKQWILSFNPSSNKELGQKIK